MSLLSRILNAITGEDAKVADTGIYTETDADTTLVDEQDTGLVPGEDFVAEQHNYAYNIDLNLDLDCDTN